MRKLTAQEIKEELMSIETILNFYVLDSFMTNNGYYSTFENGAIEPIRKEKNVVYTAIDSDECEIRIFFEILCYNIPYERGGDFVLRVTDVQKFN